MSSGDGPPPLFDGDDFSYWKIRMEAYLEAIDPGVLMVAVSGIPPLKVKDNPTGDELNYDKWNAKARNILFRGISKEVFNRIRSAKNAHEIWEKLSEMHEGSRDEREERHKVLMDKINNFKMLPHENGNLMFSRLNVLIEALNDLGIDKMKNIDIVRRILGILPKEKYAHIVTVFHQCDLATIGITQLLGKIAGHELYMGYTQEEGTSSSKKKDIAFKATKEKKVPNKKDSSDEEASDEEDVALLVRKTSKMLDKLDKRGLNFDYKKKKFFASDKNKKSIKNMQCYNCGELGHLAHSCPKPDKRKLKYKKDEDESDDEKPKDFKKKHHHKGKKQGKPTHFKKGKKKEARAYIGEWVTDEESSEASSSSSESDNKGVAGLAINTSLPPPPPSLFSTSSSHICLMAKGESKVSKSRHHPSFDSDDSDDSDGSDSDSEVPSYDELVTTLQEYNNTIIKTNGKNDKLKLEKKNLLSKLSDSEASALESKKKYDDLKESNDVLNDSYHKLKKEFKELINSYKNLELNFDALSNEQASAPQVVKVHCSTSCDDLVDPPMKPTSCATCKGKKPQEDKSSTSQVNDKLKKDHECAMQEIEKLKQQVIDLKSGFKIFSKNGNDLCEKMIVAKAINFNKNGLGYPSPKLIETAKNRAPKPKVKYCTKCQQEGHFQFECKTPSLPKLPEYLRPRAFNVHYGLSKLENGKVMARFFGPKDKSRPKQIWVPKCLVASANNPHVHVKPSPTPTQAFYKVWVTKSQA
jgi:hypothetical protein